MNHKTSHSIAWEYFWPEGHGKAKPGYVLHHINYLLREFDPNRYNAWIVNDLIMMSNNDHALFHAKLHHNGTIGYMKAIADELEHSNFGYSWLDDIYAKYIDKFKID